MQTNAQSMCKSNVHRSKTACPKGIMIMYLKKFPIATKQIVYLNHLAGRYITRLIDQTLNDAISFVKGVSSL